MTRATERASQHNAESLCAVAPPASVPIVETQSVWRRRCDCSPLSRPHNLHYVEMPAAQGKSLARLPLRGLFDRDGQYEQQPPPQAALASTSSRCSNQQKSFSVGRSA